MMKTQIGLGVLSIPAVFDTLGMAPGLICLVAIAVITTWSDYMVGVFKLNHREVYGIDDAGGIMFGRFGREFLGAAFCLCKGLPLPEDAECLVLTEITRLDLRGRLRHAHHLDRLERRVCSRHLHGRLCLRGRHPGIRLWQHSDPWAYQFPRLDRSGVYSNCKCVSLPCACFFGQQVTLPRSLFRDHRRWSRGSPG